MNKLRALLFVTLAAFVAGACATPRAKKKGADGMDSAKTQSQQDDGSAAIPEVDVQEASIHGKDFVPVAGLEPIYFDYDSATLKEAQLDILKKNAERIKTRRNEEILVAGFCDDRGTTEYNLALGQKRAKEVREYYIRLGVPGKSVATISYGKESPSCAEQTEECWGQNRRAETRVRQRVSNNGKDEKQPQ